MMVGSEIGSYRIERVLGEGGMGVVYVGVDLRLGRRAALKQLLPELSGQRHVVERFFNEAKAAANINHPGIVEIYEVGWHTDGSAYFAMKLLDGDSLAKRLRAGTMPLTTACTMARQISSALAAAHAAGIVHRDLKPDNIILVRDDEVAGGERPILLDFGIAKLTGDWRISQMTRTHTVMGTPWYMSPEQCRGAGDVDHRTDVYAVGCLLFEMLTGRPPFVADGAGEVLGMHQFVPPPTVRSLRREVPPALEAVVMRCLAKQPDQRYPRMAELIAALQACLPRLGAQDSGAIGAHRIVRGGAFPPSESLPSGPVTMPPLLSTLTGGRGEISSRQAGARRRGLVLGGVAAAVAIAVAVVVIASGPSESSTELVAAAPKIAASASAAPTPAASTPAAPRVPAAMAPEPSVAVPTPSVATTPTAAQRVPPVGEPTDESQPKPATSKGQASIAPPAPKETPAPTVDKTAGDAHLPDGLDRAMIADGVAKVKARAQTCGDKHPAIGQVKVSVNVGPDGNVTAVTVRSTPDQGLGSCVAAVMQTVKFAKTRGGGSFTYPFQFGTAVRASDDSYEGRIQRANAIASSNCNEAMYLYAKALQLKPNGIEALVGIGYCQMHANEFASAASKFRVALAISPNFEPALRGVAETYQQLGYKERAIEAYKHYLEVYPESAAAKSQLERLEHTP